MSIFADIKNLIVVSFDAAVNYFVAISSTAPLPIDSMFGVAENNNSP